MMSLFTVDDMKGRWEHQVDKAKQFWDKLMEDEMLEADTREEKHAGLVKERSTIVCGEDE